MTETLLDPTRLDVTPPDRVPVPWWRQSLRVLVVLPIVVAVVRAVATGWFPIGDNALLAVRAYDVGTGHHPLLGSWTSASLAIGTNVNNPGPLYSDLLAPFMWTIGRLVGIGPATAIGVGSLNAAFALGTVVAGNRIGGWRIERWCLLLVAALTWSMGSELLIDIWQPHALLLPFVCLLVLTVAVTSGDVRLFPAWFAVASLVVQTHLAYVYVVAALGLAVVASVVGRGRAAGLSTSLRHPAVRPTVVVAVLAWIQPVIEQFTGAGEGNLQRLATSAGGGDLTVGARAATKIVAAVVALPPWWSRFGYEDSVPSTPLTGGPDGPRLVIDGLPGAAIAVVSLLAVVGVLVALAALLRTDEQRPARHAVIVSIVGVAVAIGGLTIQTVTATGLGNHQVRWVFALAVFVHVSIAWGLADLLRAHHVAVPAADRLVISVVATLTIWNLPFHAHDLGPTADRAAVDTLTRTFRDLSAFRPGGAIVFDTGNIRVFEPNSAAVMMRMRELDVGFRFEGEVDVRQFGEARRAIGDEVGVIRQYERMDALLFDGDGCTLSLRSGVDDGLEAEVDRLIEAAAADVASGRHPIDVAGLPDDVTALATAAAGGDTDAARRLVGQGLLPVLVDEDRMEATPSIAAAASANAAIIARVNSTLRIVATPATLC